MKYYYFYCITNNLNGKVYYGVHSTNNLDDGYMGSGKALRSAIKTHKIENFSKEIIKFFDTEEEMYDYERSFVNSELVNSKSCYNIAEGGHGGNIMIHLNEEQIAEWKNKISESNKGNPGPKGVTRSKETRQKLSDARHKLYEEHPELRLKLSIAHKGKPSPLKGRKWSEEQRVKQVESQKRAHARKTEEEKQAANQKRKEAWAKKTADEMNNIRNRISEVHKGKSLTEEHKQNISKSLRGTREGKNNPMYGRHWRLDPVTNKRIYF